MHSLRLALEISYMWACL